MSYLEMAAITNFGGPNGLVDTMLNHLLGTEVVNESMGSPNGVLTNFAGTLAGFPVPKSRIIITYTVGTVEYTATDDAAGFIIGTHINPTTSVLSYIDGVFDLNFTTAPDNSTTLTADYIYGEIGEDWRLIRYTYAHNGSYTDGTPVATTTAPYTYLLGTGDGIVTTFTIATVPQKSYPDEVFPMFSPKLTYTIGATVYTAHCSEIADKIHGDTSATNNTLIGDTLRFQTSGEFYEANISSSSVSWTSSRAVTVTFSTPPDNLSAITLSYYIVPSESCSPLEYIISNVGSNGLNPIFVGGQQYYALPNIGRLYVRAWNQWNDDPDNTLGYRSGEGTTCPANSPIMSSWLNGGLSLNLYSNSGRVMGWVETQSSYYQTFYTGHFLRACSPEYYANPICVSSDNNATDYGHVSTNAYHVMFAKLRTTGVRRYIMRPDNSWLEGGTNILCSDADKAETAYPIDNLLNGGVVCQPVYLWMPLGGTSSEFLGAFDGLFWSPSGSVSSLDLIDDGVYTYRVFADIGRSAWYDFFAVKRV